jgi:hypothetical protein
METKQEEKTSLNTHDYDGKLLGKYQIKTSLSKEEKEKLFNQLIAKLKEKQMDQIGIQGLQAISNSIQTAANYDPSNNWYADDILAEICLMLEQFYNQEVINSFHDLLVSQMNEMLTGGSCSQGRCTRLIQVYFPMRFYMTENQIRVNINFDGNKLNVSIIFNWNL